MMSLVELVKAPDVAVICGLPIATALANPALLIVARAASDDFYVTEAVRSAVLP